MMSPMEGLDLDLAVLAAVLVAFALVSARIHPTVLTAPMLFTAAGLVSGPELLDVIDLGLEAEAVTVVGEVSLAVLLFSDASRIELRALRRELGLPARLLGIGLPLTVALGTLIVGLLLGDFAWAEAALLAAILAPTDAALGEEVVSDPAVPVRIRQGLNVESGLNDGLVVPAVALFLALAEPEADAGTARFWAQFFFEQVGIGVLVGAGIGLAGGWLLTRSIRQGWADGVYTQLATFALAVAALTTSLTLGGNGFIAAFAAGLAFDWIAPDSEHLGEYTEDTAQLLAAISFFLFGNILLSAALGTATVAIVVCAVVVLTIGRMLPVAVALLGTGAARPTIAFVGWFGPRGLASILFGLSLFEEELARADELFAVVAWTVVFSIVAHGATAAWGARAYGRWWSSMTEDERTTMPESHLVTEHRRRSM
jgi:NhaP-type Na+/H+ or K+/H+ antiporter